MGELDNNGNLGFFLIFSPSPFLLLFFFFCLPLVFFFSQMALFGVLRALLCGILWGCGVKLASMVGAPVRAAFFVRASRRLFA